MGHIEGRATRPRLLRKQAGNLHHEIIDLLFGFMDSFKNRFISVTEAHDLSLPQGHLLMTLDEPISMRDVAAGMGYDASHITALVDQLEQRHLVERRPDPTDRRVKRIVITEGGLELRATLEDELLDTLLPLDLLTGDQRVQLRDLLALTNPGDPAATADAELGSGFLP
jgi:DNA-binding MarR family transcriptional regulator